ncbi:MAG: single-stranded DNA-binding protein [Candidatus Gastranaerophilaceae bacterium]
MNIVALMGRLTFEPELRKTPSDVSVIRFQLACDRNYTPKGAERQTDFIDCIAWRQTAEFISRNFHKGSMIAVEGALQTSNYTDKNGNQRKQVEVLANNVSFCGPKGKSESTPAGGYEQPAPSYANPEGGDFEVIDDDDDLPF